MARIRRILVAVKDPEARATPGVEKAAQIARANGAKLELFQRTAQWIMPQENPPYGEEELAEFRRHPERVPLVGESDEDRLANPMDGVSDEFVAAPRVELFGCPE